MWNNIKVSWLKSPLIRLQLTMLHELVLIDWPFDWLMACVTGSEIRKAVGASSADRWQQSGCRWRVHVWDGASWRTSQHVAACYHAASQRWIIPRYPLRRPRFQRLRPQGQRLPVGLHALFTSNYCHNTFVLDLQTFIDICISWQHLSVSPLPSARQHPSYGDCLEVRREYHQNCSVLDCVTQCSQSTAHLYEQFLQVQHIGFVTLGPLRCA